MNTWWAPYGNTVNINDTGFRPATAWRNGQQVLSEQDAANEWNKIAASHWSDRQQALRDTPEADPQETLISQLRKQYNPTYQMPGLMIMRGGGMQGPTQSESVAFQAPGSKQIQYAQRDNFPGLQAGARYLLGGKDVTEELMREQQMRAGEQKGDTGGYSQLSLDELAQERLSQARTAAAQRMTDRIMGNEPASINAISGLLSDPRVQNQDLSSVGNIVKGVYGRGLDEYVNAQNVSNAYGQPMTWAQIQDIKARQANQSKELALLQAYSSMMGAKGEMGQIVGSDYNPEIGGVQFDNDDGESRTLKMAPEQHAEVKRRFANVFFGGQGRQQPTGTPAPKRIVSGKGVKLRGPDGSVAVVRPEAVDRYKALGAVVID